MINIASAERRNRISTPVLMDSFRYAQITRIDSTLALYSSSISLNYGRGPGVCLVANLIPFVSPVSDSAT